MDCPPGFWLNRIVDGELQEEAYMSEKKTGIVAEESQEGRYAVIQVRAPQSPEHRLRPRVGLTESRRFACATLQNAVLAGILMFHSRSVLGAIARAFVCT
jgi:hypothetical protein